MIAVMFDENFDEMVLCSDEKAMFHYLNRELPQLLQECYGEDDEDWRDFYNQIIEELTDYTDSIYHCDVYQLDIKFFD